MRLDQLKRREFITLLGRTAVAWPLAARAQQPICANGQDAPGGHVNARACRTFGSYSRSVLSWTARTRLHRGAEPGHRATKRGLETGSAPRAGGRISWAKGRHDCRVEHANGPGNQAGDELDPAAVMADPVGDELIASLARPGGNVTGTTFLGPELVARTANTRWQA